MRSEGLTDACRSGALTGQGPDGKLLVRMRDEGACWSLEHVLVTIQQTATTAAMDIAAATIGVLRHTYSRLQDRDRRWRSDWRDVAVMVNPNGPLVEAGSDGDNGQTGRKLVMDFYGPRVPIGGGALSGKHLTHIDRIGAYAARQAAVSAVRSGADECLVWLAYAPNHIEPIDIFYEMSGRGERQSQLPLPALARSGSIFGLQGEFQKTGVFLDLAGDFREFLAEKVRTPVSEDFRR